MIQENFIQLYENSFKQHWDRPALTDYGTETTFTFGEVAREIDKLHILFEDCRIRQGDKVALVGKDSARWCIAFMAVVTYGAIVVPILQDFPPKDIEHIINHSGSVLLFADDRAWRNSDMEKLAEIRAAISLTDFQCLHNRLGFENEDLSIPDSRFLSRYPEGIKRETLRYAKRENEEVALINYTSGTTGFSKGVMLTGNNLAGNVTYAMTLNLMDCGDQELCFLPLAHAYSCAFNLLTPMAVGAHVYILGKLPSPNVLLKAFREVQPNLIITVPLILEKIYKKIIQPRLKSPWVKLGLLLPPVRQRIYGKICQGLKDALGGRFQEVIVGGAALNQEVAEFLHEIRFPYTVGYGMTECAPLISYDHHYAYVPGSCGSPLKGIMQARIDSPDPCREAGEIQVRGENVMTGYYKNEEATRAAFTEDGWLKTGDLGVMDSSFRLFIRGRIKSMILSSNGQNIYPEEIESKLDALPYIQESLVLEKNGKLVALVYPDYDAADKDGIPHDKIPAVLERTRKELNRHLAAYESVAEIRLHPTEFEKTPKRSIKRYLYSI